VSFAGCLFMFAPVLVVLSTGMNMIGRRARVTDALAVRRPRSPRMTEKGSSPRSSSELDHATRSRLRLCSPRVVALGAEREREAAGLLAELLRATIGEKASSSHAACKRDAAAVSDQVSAKHAMVGHAGSPSARDARARLRARPLRAPSESERVTRPRRRAARNPPGSPCG
jgi:hypothetical protein